MTPLRFGRAAAVLTLAFALVGCSRPVGTVSGSVSYNGKPLKGGSVTFVSQDGNTSRSADISETGTFSVDKLAAGEYKVCVDTSFLAPQNTSGLPTMGSGGKMMVPPPSSPTIPKGAKTAPPKDANVPEGYAPSDPAAMASANNDKKYVKIPEKYKDPATTDLRFEAKGGAETFPIELK
jgi:hypothetical protein